MSYDSIKFNSTLEGDVGDLTFLLEELREPWSRCAWDEYMRHLELFYINLYLASEADTLLRVSLNNNSYTRTGLSYRAFRRIYDRMKKLKYIKKDSGGNYSHEQGRGYQTRIKATAKLIFPKRIKVTDHHPLIVLKDANKRVIDTCADSLLDDFEKELKEQNEFIERFTISLDDKVPSITRLYRVFNQAEGHYGGEGDYWGLEGGRLYGGWWQNIKKDSRPRIEIDGEPTVELDYAYFHPTILMAMGGKSLQEDPYLHPEYKRGVIKGWVNAVINANSRTAALKSIGGKKNWGVILSCFPSLEPYIGKAVGRRLQYIDSQIAERVLKKMRRKGIACLPVHDSFIVPVQHEQTLLAAMHQYFKGVVGDHPISIKRGSLTTP